MKKTILFSLLSLLLFTKASALQYYVTSTSDLSSGSGTSGTLRWCMTQAELTTARDTINFSVAGTWSVGSTLPTIINPVTINGFSAPGAVQGQLGTSTRVMKVILSGPGDNTVFGFQINGNNSEISGIVIQNFYEGIFINGGDNNWIWGCYIGTSADGSSVSAATSCFDDGITLSSGANTNIIGTNGNGSNDANEGNLITGNGDGGTQYLGEGISINFGGSLATDCTGNRISGNYIGTDETGTIALYRGSVADLQRGTGIQVNYSTATIIGTNADGTSDVLERNVISGNSDCGIVLVAATGTKIKGNYIGTTKTGLAGLPNYSNEGTKINSVQITIRTGSNNNYIGTDGDGVNDNIEGNVIGSSTIAAGGGGVSYSYAFYINASTGNRISGNYIGIGSDGVTPLNILTTSGNYFDKGIYISGGSTSTIVGTNGDGVSDAYEKNYFGNTTSAVTIDNSNSCIVAGNYFGLGTNLTTAEPLVNSGGFYSSGTYILNSTSCRIGSSASNSLERNYFCNSGYDGVWIDGAGTANTDANTVRYNTFGMRPDGVAAANAYHAVEVYKISNGNTIQDNIITQNGTIAPAGTYSAILIGGINSGEEASDNLIYQNQIYKNIGRGVDILNVNSVKSSLGLRNKISQNSIYDNGNASNSTASTPSFGKYSLGIDLDYDGTTANDSKDADDGPNEQMNFPIITGASTSGTGCANVTVSGTYNGLPGTSFSVELFSSDVCNGDTAGTDYYSNSTYNYGEGRTYLGAATFTTAGNGGSAGNGTWSLLIPISSLSGKYLTAVAIQTSGTNPGNTSEFSQCYPLTFDAGDAPDTYHTLLTNCGPAHFGTAAANNPVIGTSTTADTDGQPAVQADLDTDDGLTTFPTLSVKSTAYSLSVPVKNNSGSAATLYAWIDFNRNGSFESTEFTSVSIPTSASSQTATLNWNLSGFTCGSTLVSGISYLRMRITTTALTDVAGTTTVDERSYGIASNGEVEDYKIYISGVDYGDLPNTYPVATAICLEDTATAKVWAGITMPSTECTQNYSADAYGEGPEEDGLTTSIGNTGSTYTWIIKLNANQANTTVYYGLWLDWNADKVFSAISPDKIYTGSVVCNGPTTTTISVLIPPGLSTSAGFRLIASSTSLSNTSYNATVTNGEIEDYLLLRILNAPGNILMGSRQSHTNLLKWKNSNSLSVVSYVIERSSDNISWNRLGTVYPSPTDNNETQYTYSDIHPLKDKNYYRLKLLYVDNSIHYTNTVSLADNTDITPVIVYPNPATNKLNIQTTNANYNKLKIIDVTGRVEITADINAVNTAVDISKLSPGTHLIKFITQSGEEQVQRFVKIK